LKKYKSPGKAVAVTVSSKEENSSDFCLDFVQEFDLSISRRPKVVQEMLRPASIGFLYIRFLQKKHTVSLLGYRLQDISNIRNTVAKAV
jgi:hypothetical protein